MKTREEIARSRQTWKKRDIELGKSKVTSCSGMFYVWTGSVNPHGKMLIGKFRNIEDVRIFLDEGDLDG